MNMCAAWTDFFNYKLLNNEVWHWLALLGVLLVSFFAGKVLSFFFQQQARRLAARDSKYLSLLLQSLAGPATLAVLGGGLYVASTFLSLTYTAEEGGKVVTQDLLPFWLNVCRTFLVLAVTWLIFKLVDIVELVLKKWASRSGSALDDQLVPILRKTLRAVVVIMAGLFIAQNVFRMDIAALIAGLGLGGLAFALAAKEMLSNFFGSITLFSDRPFAMGDRIKVGAVDGNVEEVGFRSTRIRTLEGSLVTIPNGVLANEPIENVTRRPYIRRVLNVTVTCDTPPEKLQRGAAILKEMLEARKGSFDPALPPRVYFSDFNADSLNLAVYYWFAPPDFGAYQQFNHDFNSELLRRFNEEGIEFAFPTRTLYVKQSSPLEADVRVKVAGGEG